MGATEVWYTIKDGNLYMTEQNDGYRYMRRGLETEKTLLCTVEEAVKKYPYELAKAQQRK